MPSGFQQIHNKEEVEAEPPPPEPGLTPTLALAVGTAALGSLQLGFHVGVINTLKKVLEQEYNVTWARRWGAPPTPGTVSALWELSVAIFFVGGLVAVLGVGKLAESLGRKYAMIVSNVLAFLGGALLSGAKLGPSYVLIITGRFILGAYSGLASGLVPLYMGEIAPTRLRRALGTVHQLAIVIGILVAQVLGLEKLLGSAKGWPLLLGLGLVPALLQVLLLPLCPESPRFLLSHGHGAQARHGLTRLVGAEAAEAALEALGAELQGHNHRYRQLLKVVVGLQLCQHFSSINIILFHSTAIFEQAGLSHPAYATIGASTINVAVTVLSLFLVERFGRRMLLLLGLLGMLVFDISFTVALSLQDRPGTGVAWLVAVLGFVVFLKVVPGPIPWFLGVELFAQSPCPAAVVLAGAANWATNFIVIMAFPKLQRALGPFVFLLSWVLLAGLAQLTLRWLPETWGCSFSEGGGGEDKATTELQRLGEGGGDEEPD